MKEETLLDSDLILTKIPKDSNVKCARIASICEEGYILSVETSDGYKDDLAGTLHRAKKLFAERFYPSAKWEYE